MPRQLVVSADGHTDIVPSGPVGPPGRTGDQGPRGIQGLQGLPGAGAEYSGTIVMQGDTQTIGGTQYQVFDFTDPSVNWGQFALMIFDEDNPTVQRYLLDLPDPEAFPLLPIMTMAWVSFAGTIDETFEASIRTDGGSITPFGSAMETLWPSYGVNGWLVNLTKIDAILFGAPESQMMWYVRPGTEVNPRQGHAGGLSCVDGDPTTTGVIDLKTGPARSASSYMIGASGYETVQVLVGQAVSSSPGPFLVHLHTAADVTEIQILGDDGFGTPYAAVINGADLEKLRYDDNEFEFIVWPRPDSTGTSFFVHGTQFPSVTALEERMDTAETNITNHGGRITALESADAGDWGGFSTPTLPWHEVDHGAEDTPTVALDHGYAVEEHIIGAAGAVVDITWTNPGAGKIARQHLKLRASNSIGSFGTSQSGVTVNGEGWPSVALTWSLYDIWIVGQGTEYSGDPAAVYVNTLMHNITFGT